MEYLKKSLKNLIRNKTSLISTILIVGVIVFLINIMFGINVVLQKILEKSGQEIKLTLYLKEYIDPAKVREAKAALEKLSFIEKITYVSEEEALVRLTKNYEKSSEILTKYNIENPLPESFEIQTKTDEDQKKLIEFAKKSPFFENVQEIGESDMPQNLKTAMDAIKNIRIWVGFILLLSMFLVIEQTIILNGKRRKEDLQEITLEGSILGTLGVIFGCILIILFGTIIKIGDTSLLSYINPKIWTSIFLIEILLGILIGATCAIITPKE